MSSRWGEKRFTEVRDQQRRVRLEELTQTRELATARQAIERRSRGANPVDRGVEIASLPANPRGANLQRPGRSEGLPTASNNRLNPRPTRDTTGTDLPPTNQSGGRRPGRSEGLPASGVPEAECAGIVGREATGGGLGGRAPLDAAVDRSGVRRAAEEAAGANRQRRSAVEQAQARMAERSPRGNPADRGVDAAQGTTGRRIAPGTSETELRSWVENYQRGQGVDPNTARRLGERLVPPGSQRRDRPLR